MTKGYTNGYWVERVDRIDQSGTETYYLLKDKHNVIISLFGLKLDLETAKKLCDSYNMPPPTWKFTKVYP